MEITELPFNQLIGIRTAKAPTRMLALPADARYGNHLGTVHASALLALAEATSGAWLLREFRDLGFEVLPVVRRIEAKFRKPARGEVSSEAAVAAEQKAEFVATLAAKGRALLTVHVDVYDEHGTHALAAEVEWFVARSG